MARPEVQGSVCETGQVWTSKSGQVRWRVDGTFGDNVTVQNVRSGYTVSLPAHEFLEHMRPEPDHD